MIDWVNLAFNALWIFGLSILLAAVSYHRWLAWEQDGAFRELMSRRSWKLPFASGMLLVCGGVAGGIVERGWERAIWTALGAFYAYQLMLVLRQPVKPTRS
jgi:putative copper export protein